MLFVTKFWPMIFLGCLYFTEFRDLLALYWQVYLLECCIISWGSVWSTVTLCCRSKCHSHYRHLHMSPHHFCNLPVSRTPSNSYKKGVMKCFTLNSLPCANCFPKQHIEINLCEDCCDNHIFTLWNDWFRKLITLILIISWMSVHLPSFCLLMVCSMKLTVMILILPQIGKCYNG